MIPGDVQKQKAGVYLVTDANGHKYTVTKGEWTKRCGGYRWRITDVTGWLTSEKSYLDCLEQIGLWE